MNTEELENTSGMDQHNQWDHEMRCEMMVALKDSVSDECYTYAAVLLGMNTQQEIENVDSSEK